MSYDTWSRRKVIRRRANPNEAHQLRGVHARDKQAVIVALNVGITRSLTRLPLRPHHTSPRHVSVVPLNFINSTLGMPRDLPGLYWDEEKKRYFPLSSRPASSQSQPGPSTLSSSDKAASRKKKKGITYTTLPENGTSVVPASPRKRRRVDRFPSSPAGGRPTGVGLRSAVTHSQMRRSFQYALYTAVCHVANPLPQQNHDSERRVDVRGKALLVWGSFIRLSRSAHQV